MSHLDLISGLIALAFAWTSAQLARKVRQSRSASGIHVGSIALPTAVNAWFVYFYFAAGFKFAAACEIACVAAYLWWLVEYRRAAA